MSYAKTSSAATHLLPAEAQAQLVCVDMSLPEADIAAAVRKAARGSGFMYVVNAPGITPEDFEKLFQVSKSFFDLPESEKNRILANQDNGFRGYTPFYEEKLDVTAQNTGDTKEGFYMGPTSDQMSPDDLQPKWSMDKVENLWPLASLLPEFRPFIESYHKRMTLVFQKMVQYLALGLDKEPTFFDRDFAKPLTKVRLLHYSPTVASDPTKGVFACGAHSDWGMLTLLATNTVPGLEIFNRDVQQWQRVAPMKNAFVANLGNMAERWSGDLYRSTIHRVILTAEEAAQHRMSVAFFCEPPPSCVVKTVIPEKKKKYPDIHYGDYLIMKFTETSTMVPATEA